MTAPQHPRNAGQGGQYPTGQYPPAPYPGGAVPPGPIGAPMGSHAAPPPPSPTLHPAGPYEDVGNVSVGELVGNVTRDLSTLMRQELALAQAEVKAEVSKTGKAAGALGAAGFAGYMAVLFLSICLWWALGHLIGNSWSALVVAVLWGIVGAVLYSSGRKKLREVNPTPERTVDTLKNVPDALKGEAGGHR
ncbi:MAG TPA: phage holin family protein [Pseudonocardia sp.]|nr:phage holin family protein [Pseudonocardia sp.]